MRGICQSNGETSHLLCQMCGKNVGIANNGLVRVEKPVSGERSIVFDKELKTSDIVSDPDGAEKYLDAVLRACKKHESGDIITQNDIAAELTTKSADELMEQLWDLGNTVSQMKKLTPYQITAAKIGNLVSDRQETYGDSFGKSGERAAHHVSRRHISRSV